MEYLTGDGGMMSWLKPWAAEATLIGENGKAFPWASPKPLELNEDGLPVVGQVLSFDVVDPNHKEFVPRTLCDFMFGDMSGQYWKVIGVAIALPKFGRMEAKFARQRMVCHGHVVNVRIHVRIDGVYSGQ